MGMEMFREEVEIMLAEIAEINKLTLETIERVDAGMAKVGARV